MLIYIYIASYWIIYAVYYMHICIYIYMRKYTLYVIPYAEFTRTHVYIVHIISQLGGLWYDGWFGTAFRYYKEQFHQSIPLRLNNSSLENHGLLFDLLILDKFKPQDHPSSACHPIPVQHAQSIILSPFNIPIVPFCFFVGDTSCWVCPKIGCRYVP